MIALLLAFATPAALGPQEELVGRHPYERRATRLETERHMRARLDPGRAEWGTGHTLAPFPFAGHGQDDLRTPHSPEDELARLVANGPGPDLGRVHAGKDGVEARWPDRGRTTGAVLTFDTFEEAGRNVDAVAYFHTTLTVDRARTLAVTCGSDDGLRLWLNGELLVDRDVGPLSRVGPERHAEADREKPPTDLPRRREPCSTRDVMLACYTTKYGGRDEVRFPGARCILGLDPCPDRHRLRRSRPGGG